MSFVETFEESKKEIKHIAKNLKENGFISEETLNNVYQALEKEKITIAIVGQMKYGKSTFVNAFLFKDKFLPTSDTPMTAALTKIVYNKAPSFIVEFYTKEELESLKKQAMKEKDNNNFEEFLDKLSYIESEVQDLLGTKKVISAEEFEDYVGADGKFTPIAKMLIINHNSDILKETIVVDTPGLNDPVESREKITENFLSQADVIIIFLYANRPFDNNDRELIVEKLSFAGTGKVALVINKKDMILEELGTLDKVQDHIKHSLQKAVNESVSSEVLKNTLLNAPLIPMSSLWALIGRVDENTIEEDEELKWYYDDFREKFPFLRTKDDFEKYSGILDLEKEIEDIIKNEKIKIIRNKAENLIISDILHQLKELTNKKSSLDMEYHTLNKTEGEIEKNIQKFESFKEEKYPTIVNIEEIKSKVYKIFLNKEEEIDTFLHKKLNEVRHKVESIEMGLWDEIVNLFNNKYTKKVNSILNEEIIEIREKFREDLYEIKREFIEELGKWLEKIIDKLLNEEVIKSYVNVNLGSLNSWKDYIIELYNLNWDDKIRNIQLYVKFEKGENNTIANVIEENIEYVREKIKKDILRETFKATIEDSLIKVKKEIDDKIINEIERIYKKVKREMENKEKRQKEIQEKLNMINQKIEELNEVKKQVEKKLRNI